jgi:hypothetical protein
METKLRLSQVQLTILMDLLRETSGTLGVNAVRFRAKHSDDLSEIDALERNGFVERKDNVYVIKLVAIAALKPKSPQAERLLVLCQFLFETLQRLYKKDPERLYKVLEVAKEADLPKEDVLRGAQYLHSAPIWGTQSPNLSDEDAVLQAGESILRYKTFHELLEQLRAWIIQNQLPQAPAIEFAPKKASLAAAPSYMRSEPEWLKELDAPLRNLFKEVYSGLQHDLQALPAMGLRAIIDGVCNDLVGDKGGFAKKLQLLVAYNYITTRKKEIIENVVEVGHASTHRGHFPAPKDLAKVLEIVEHVVYEFFVMERVSRGLRASTKKTSKDQKG